MNHLVTLASAKPHSVRCRYKKDKKLVVYVDCDMEKAFNRVLRKVMEWALRKKDLSEIMVRAVMSLCDGAKTRVSVGSAY